MTNDHHFRIDRGLASAKAEKNRLFKMGRFEVLTTQAASIIVGSLAIYWTLVLAVDGNEGSFITHPLNRGYCSPPFQVYGLGCREWVVNAASMTAWQITIFGIAAFSLTLAAKWRRALLAALIALLVTAFLLPTAIAIWPTSLFVLYFTSACIRFRRINAVN